MEQEFFHVELIKSVQVAIPLAAAAEVFMVESQALCPIPGVAPALLGVTNQRGKLLWVVDLGYLLGLKKIQEPPPRRAPVLVINWGHGTQEYRLGCLTTQLRGIVACEAKDIHPVPERLEKRMHQFFSAWIRPPGSSLLLLNIEALFSAVQLYSSSTAMALL